MSESVIIQAYASELCAAYRRILDREQELLGAYERIVELQALLAQRQEHDEALKRADRGSSVADFESLEESDCFATTTTTTGIRYPSVDQRAKPPPPPSSPPPEDTQAEAQYLAAAAIEESPIRQVVEEEFDVQVRAAEKPRHYNFLGPLRPLDPNITRTPTFKQLPTSETTTVRFYFTPATPVVAHEQSSDRRLSNVNGWSVHSEQPPSQVRQRPLVAPFSTPKSRLYETPTRRVRRSEPRSQSERPPFIPGGSDTFFNIHSVRQKRDRERLEDSVMRQPRHRPVVQQPLY